MVRAVVTVRLTPCNAAGDFIGDGNDEIVVTASVFDATARDALGTASDGALRRALAAADANPPDDPS